MEKKRSVEIILIGIFAIILGGWNLFHMAGGIFYMLLDFLQTGNVIELLRDSKFIFYFLVLICFLIGGISFILLKKWGKVLVHVCLVTDILFRSFGIIRYWYIWFTMEKPSAIPENAYVMIPTYVIVLIEVAALYLITRPKVKDQFKVAERKVTGKMAEGKRSIGITILSALEVPIGMIGVIYSIPRLNELTFFPGENIFSFIFFLLMLIAGISTFFLKIAGWVLQFVLAFMGILACIGMVCFISAGIPFLGGGLDQEQILFIFFVPIFITGILCFFLKIRRQFLRLAFLLMAVTGLIGLIYFGHAYLPFGGDYLMGPLILGLLFMIPILLMLYITRSKIKEQFQYRFKITKKDTVILTTIIILGVIVGLIILVRIAHFEKLDRLRRAKPEHVKTDCTGYLIADTTIQGITFPKGTHLLFYYGKLQVVILSEPLEIQGIKFAEETEIFFYESGMIESASLVEDQEIQGIGCEGGFRSIKLHESGKLKSAELAEDQEIQGIKCSSKRYIELYESGKLKSTQLAEDQEIQGIKCYYKVSFYESGKLNVTNLSEPLEIQGIKCESHGEISLYESGKLKSAELDGAQEIQGIKSSSMHYIELYESGRLKSTQLAENQKIKGRNYHQGHILEFDENGKVVAVRK